MTPPEFGDAFLEWFRDATERAWDAHEARSFDDYEASGVGGLDWQPGTRWLDGMTDGEIDEVERRWGLRFPPDHRLFLRRLHATDRPMTGALFVSGDTLAPVERPGVYNWLTDGKAIAAAYENVIGGLAFDVEHNGLWRDGWGARPSTAEAREAVVRAQVASAPKLAPVFAHRALVAEPCRAGNPVLSIHQSDIIVYGGDLRAYLLAEFGRLIGVREPELRSLPAEWLSIPFWGGFLA